MNRVQINCVNYEDILVGLRLRGQNSVSHWKDYGFNLTFKAG